MIMNRLLTRIMALALMAGAISIAVLPGRAESEEKKDDFGLFVTELKKKGLTGEELAKAIHAERDRRKAIEDAAKEAKKKESEKQKE